MHVSTWGNFFLRGQESLRYMLYRKIGQGQRGSLPPLTFCWLRPCLQQKVSFCVHLVLFHPCALYLCEDLKKDFCSRAKEYKFFNFGLKSLKLLLVYCEWSVEDWRMEIGVCMCLCASEYICWVFSVSLRKLREMILEV